MIKALQGKTPALSNTYPWVFDNRRRQWVNRCSEGDAPSAPVMANGLEFQSVEGGYQYLFVCELEKAFDMPRGTLCDGMQQMASHKAKEFKSKKNIVKMASKILSQTQASLKAKDEKVLADWKTTNIGQMRALVRLKFQEPHTRGVLLSTGSLTIEEAKEHIIINRIYI